MNGTLFSLGLLDTWIGFAVAGLLGVLFGFFLEQAGFGSSRKLTGIFYLRDMAVLKVMFTAVVTAMIGYQYLVGVGWLHPAHVFMLDTYWGPQVIGGLIFGVGFVLGGWCPGTALAGLASLKWDALVFLAGSLIGSVVFNEVYDLIRSFYEGECAGTLFLSDSLNLRVPFVVVAVTAVAILAFAGSTRLEQRVADAPEPDEGTRRVRRTVAVLALILAVGTHLFPPPGADAPSASVGPAASLVAQDASAILEEVGSAQDHIDPTDLADRLVSGEAGLTVVDLRPADDFAAFHIRGAVSIPLENLAGKASRIGKTGRVVLYSNGTTHAAQAWLILRQMGWRNVYVLTDGILGFWRDCLTPPSLARVADETWAASQSATFAARRAFFLGGGAAAAAGEGAAEEKPKPPALAEGGLAQHLVSADWLAARLAEGKVRLLDVRAKSTDYTKAHIPGALYLNFENIRATIDGVPNTLVPGEDIARMLGRLGIAAGDTVVVYSDQLRDATLVAVALMRVGHRSFAVLHGGWDQWVAEGRPKTSAVPDARPATYDWARGADTFTVSTDGVYATLGLGRTVIIDVRPPDYFSGKKSEEARAGHIPGARNREFTLDLVPGTQCWQAADLLKAEYARLGVSEDTPVIVHCRTGHQASQTFFLLRHVLGLKSVRWYDGSWLAWSLREDLPVEK